MFFCLNGGRKTNHTVMANLIQWYMRWAVLFLLTDEINTAQFTITPQQITVGGQNPTLDLNGTCTPNAPGITVLYVIEIGKRSLSVDRAIVQIALGDNSPTIMDPGLQSRLTVSGSINGASGSLQFSLRDPTCSDVDSTFYCKTMYNTADRVSSDETTRNITARTYPGTIRMIPTPDRVQYNPPVLVQFTCTGLIGNTFPSNQANFWQWQWRSVGDINTQWTTYPYSANITYRTPSPSGSCNYNGGSTLTHTVTDLDNGRQFRCSVVNDQYSDNKTVYTQAPPVNTAQLTITPQQITVGGQNPTLYLNGTCTPNAPGITKLYNIEIGRRSIGIDRAIVQIETGDTSPSIKDPSLQSRLTVSGSINGASGSLQFSLRDPTCTDVDSTFYCKTSYNTASGGRSDETTKNITARSYPGTIRMIPTPDRVQYEPPVLVQFTCTGLIGNTFPSNQANFWQWQWRSVGDINTQWTTYPYPANITYRTPSPSGSCNYNGGSTLTHTVTDLDNGRQFRCSVVNDQYSENKTVYTQTLPVTGVTPTLPPECFTNTERIEYPRYDYGTTLGFGIAIGIGIMLVVIIVFLIFVFIFRMEVAACLTGGRNKGGKVPDSGMSFQDISGGNAQTSQIHARETSNRSIPTTDYQVLDANTRDGKISNTYEKIHEYQNN